MILFRGEGQGADFSKGLLGGRGLVFDRGMCLFWRKGGYLEKRIIFMRNTELVINCLPEYQSNMNSSVEIRSGKENREASN